MERREDFLQYIWKFRLFSTPLLDPCGSLIEVIDTGHLNTDSGPDFFNARIKTGPLSWAGNVEIHLKASDWVRHGHHCNPAYDNVILHGVVEKDREVWNSKGRKILTVNMEFSQNLWSNYKELTAIKETIPCWEELASINRDRLNIWLERLYMERLEERTKAVKLSLAETNNDWEEVLYRAMGRAMGQKTNAEPFELLTRTISLGKINRYCPDLHSKESILFGQAGMLSSKHGDAYYLSLQKSYDLLRHRLRLQPMESYLWKYLRLRPMNFPDIRIAQFAWMLDKYPALFYRLSNANDPAAFFMKMKLGTSLYWMTHFRLNKPGQWREKVVGPERISGLLINAVVPVLCTYLRDRGNMANLLEIYDIPVRLPFENNRVIRVWKSLGIPVRDGFSSQAILQLTNKYCKFKRCLSCYVDNQIIKTSQEMEDR
jgi:hypothetical protein